MDPARSAPTHFSGSKFECQGGHPPRGITGPGTGAGVNTLFALVTINRDVGRNATALAWADRLVVVDPQSRPLRDEIARLADVR